MVYGVWRGRTVSSNQPLLPGGTRSAFGLVHADFLGLIVLWEGPLAHPLGRARRLEPRHRHTFRGSSRSGLSDLIAAGP